MALTELPTATGIDSELHVDRFGLTIGCVSVGLPVTCTNDMVLLRYIDLINLIQAGPSDVFAPSDGDIATLAAAIGEAPDVVHVRLRTLAG